MFLPAGTKESFSTEEIRRRPGHKCCQPVWEVCRKLRDVTGKRDGRYRLCGQVEPGDGFLAIELPLGKRDEPLKRGHGSQKKAKVLVMVESAPSQKNPGKGRPSKTAGHLKMQAMPGLKSETITKIVKVIIKSKTDTCNYTLMSSVISSIDDISEKGSSTESSWRLSPILPILSRKPIDGHYADNHFIFLFLSQDVGEVEGFNTCTFLQ